MTESNVEILSPYPFGAIHRMKINPLIHQKPGGLNFCNFGDAGTQPVGLLINGLYIDPDKEPDLADMLEKRARHAVIMLFIPDIGAKSIPLLKKWSKFVDVFLLPSPEMKKFIQLFTERPTEVLFDPIDFGFADSFTQPTDHSGPLKVVWFGFPDSYQKSMVAHEQTLTALHQKKKLNTISLRNTTFPGIYPDAYYISMFRKHFLPCCKALTHAY
jgi:hypothetical protein